MKNLRYFALLCLCAFLVQTASAETPRFDAMYVFGDSLSDNGNDFILDKLLGANPAVPPSESPHRTYYQGRFSNGPVAFEYLWRLIKQNPSAKVAPSLTFARPSQKGAISYAFGGAPSGLVSNTPGGISVPGLLGQVEALRLGLFGRKPPARSLFAIWIGANDYAVPVPAAPQIVVSNIKLAVQRLYRIGGRQFLVLNLPDLGLTPIAQAQGAGAALSALSRFHNALLGQAIAELATTLPGIQITSFDVFALGQNLLGSTISGIPALETLAPGSSSCLLVNPATCPDVPLTLNDPFFYWDVEHPTTLIHSVLGQAMYDAMLQ
jgi:phospholipase/lecithinase/hemolysin